MRSSTASIAAFGLAFLTVVSAIPSKFGVAEVVNPTNYNWTSGYDADFTIHSSCNASQSQDIRSGLIEAVAMAEHAKDNLLIHGNNSAIFQKWFGQGSVGAVLGWFEKISAYNREGILFRCDDPDQNCKTHDGWAGHWRGSNASMETVICERSYSTRRQLDQLCANGFATSTCDPEEYYWAADLIHRLFHLDVMGEGLVTHHAEGYQESLDLIKCGNYTLATMNSHSLIYFATETYAFDIIRPGEGCVTPS